MGLLDSVLGMVAGGQQGGGNAALISAVVGMLANNGQGGGGGGLADILGKAQQAGLGDVVSSWIGTGQNMPISADQLHNVLGSDAIANIAQQLGLRTATPRRSCRRCCRRWSTSSRRTARRRRVAWATSARCSRS